MPVCTGAIRRETFGNGLEDQQPKSAHKSDSYCFSLGVAVLLQVFVRVLA